MSKVINELPCEFCKADCPAMDLVVKADVVYVNNEIYDRVITLECNNESLCRYIRKRCEKHGT